MSVNTARMLNSTFSNPAWKLLLVMGLRFVVETFSFKIFSQKITVIRFLSGNSCIVIL